MTKNFMPIKNFFCSLLIVSAIFLPFTVKSSYKEGLLWEIESPSGRKSILFGTMHYIDERVLHVFKLVEKHMINASSISVEYAPSDEDIPTIEKMLFKTDTHIRDYLTSAEYKKFLDLIKLKNIPLEEIEYASPFHIVNLIVNPKLMTELHLDAQIVAYALDNEIQLNGLEDVNSSATITNFDLKYTVREIKAIINNPEIINIYLEKTKKLYLEENLAEMNNLLRTSTPVDFFEQVIVHRNKIMFDALSKIVDEGNAFIAVGAAHLGENEGLLNLLSQSGYKISRIPLSF